MKTISSLLFSCVLSLTLSGQNNVSVTASGKVIDGIAGITYGINFSFVNIETGTIYYSELLSIFKQRYSIIENLPPGKYQIFYFGGSAIVESIENPVHQYFGYFEFEAGKSYYLGSFIGKMKIGKYGHRPIIYTIKCDEIPKKVIKTLKKRKLIEKVEELIKTYPYNSDTLKIGVEQQR